MNYNVIINMPQSQADYIHGLRVKDKSKNGLCRKDKYH